MPQVAAAAILELPASAQWELWELKPRAYQSRPQAPASCAVVANRIEHSFPSQPIARSNAEKCALRGDGGLLPGPGEEGPPESGVRVYPGSLGLEVGNIIKRFSPFRVPSYTLS